MQVGAKEVLQRLIYHTHPENFDTFLKYFDEKERNDLKAFPKHEAPLALHLDQTEEMLHSFHYSWFIEPLEKCSKKLKEHVLSVFSEEQQQKLQKYLGIKSSKKKLSPIVYTFFSHWFLEQLGYKQLPPTCFFSDSKCLKLTKMDKVDLVKILHNLGVIEMANIAKRIVDKKTLNELLNFFNASQRKLFNEAQKKYNDPQASTIKDLKKRLEDDRTFLNFLEKNGILRLAKGLACESSFLIWHLAHILDRGRGAKFLSVIRKCVPNPHTPYYTKQVLEISQSLEEQ